MARLARFDANQAWPLGGFLSRVADCLCYSLAARGHPVSRCRAIFYLRFIVRNLGRHPLRTGLTVAGIVVAVRAFGILRTVVDTWYAGAEATSAKRLITRQA